MVTGLIPHRYAMALYKYAMETKTGDKVYEEMKRVADAFQLKPGSRESVVESLREERRQETRAFWPLPGRIRETTFVAL